MARNSIRGGGDALARGARSMTFAAGGSKAGDKIQINKGIVMSEEDRKALDKAAPAPMVAEKKIMKRKPRPLYDRVVIRPKTVEEVSKGGIIIAKNENEKERPREGVVVFVGKGKIDINGVRRPLEVKPGDTVLFGQYAGTDVSIDDEIVLMVREEEILAVIE